MAGAVLEVIVAQSAGFCRGVRRAVQLAEGLAVAGGRGRRIVTLGPLIHNEAEVERLRLAGVAPASEEEICGSSAEQRVIVRAHGARAELLALLRGRANVELVDATCPHVRALQGIAARMARAGYAIVVVGDHDHAETDSVLSFAREARSKRRRPVPALVVGGPAELAGSAELDAVRRVAVLAQTTLTAQRLAEVAGAACASERFAEVRLFNTICTASLRRQSETRALAAEAQVMFVVGGRHSANTRRLLEICSERMPHRSHLVQSAADIRPEWLDGIQRVGVTAGASTPGRSLTEVVACLRRIGCNNEEAMERR